METIIVAFTLKGQDFEQIRLKLAVLAGKLPNPTLLIHGFLPKAVLEEKKIPTDVIDALTEYFPLQLNMFANGKPLRAEMAEIASKLNATVYVIGEIKEGVAEEKALYEGKGVKVIHLPIL